VTAALIIVLAVAIPIGLYAYWEHRYRQIEREQQCGQERDLLGEFRRWDEDGRP
jgi:hypothetical protein